MIAPNPAPERAPHSTRALLLALAGLAVAISALLAVREALESAHIAMVLLLVVLASSALAGRRAGYLVAVVSFISFNFFFVEPYFTFRVDDPRDWLVLLAYLVTAVVSTELLTRARQSAELADARARALTQVEALREVESLRTALLMAVSHDLRTPLTTIKALAHELQSSQPSTTAAVIEAEADRLNAMIDDLLDLSRLQAGAVTPRAAHNTIDELIGAALQRVHGSLAMRPVAVTLPEDLLTAHFDLSLSVRVLANLLENAAKYAHDAGSIELSAQVAGDMVEVVVRDDGPGVPTADRARIFEPFYRPAHHPPDVRGSGLGLSIARGLAEVQGGYLVLVEDGRPRGASFAFGLPTTMTGSVRTSDLTL
jgi:two-component system sensor histidine kinase KdpD